MAIKKCRICGEKLTKCNKYKANNSHKLGRICYKCYIVQKKSKYGRLTKKYKTNLWRNGRQIVFNTIEEKRAFAHHMAKEQYRIHTRSSTCSSRDGQSVSVFMENVEKQYYEHYCYMIGICPECDSVVRYDEHGDRVCESCGLMDSSTPLSYTKTFKNAHGEIEKTGIEPDVDIIYLKKYEGKFGGLNPIGSYGRSLNPDDSNDQIVLKYCMIPQSLIRTPESSFDKMGEIEDWRALIVSDYVDNLNGEFNSVSRREWYDHKINTMPLTDELRAKIIETKKRAFPNNPEKWFVNFPEELDLEGNLITES